jgi:hypothetical protein
VQKWGTLTEKITNNQLTIGKDWKTKPHPGAIAPKIKNQKS